MGDDLQAGIPQRGPSLGLQFVSFAYAGAVGTAVQYLVLPALVVVFSVHPVMASTVGYLAGMWINYLLNHHWVFRSGKRHCETAFRFLLISGAGLALNVGLMHLGIDVLGLHYLLAQVAATAVVLLWNFAGNRFWTFADAAEKSA